MTRTNPFTSITPDVDTYLWAAAVIVFVVADAVTTTYGLQLAGVIERHPVSTSVLRSWGLVGVLGMKAAVVGVGLAFFVCADPRFRTAIPASLVGVGTVIAVVNVAVIAAAV